MAVVSSAPTAGAPPVAEADPAPRQNRAPRLFYLDAMPEQLVAEATDGLLYVVENERGGWHRRTLYTADKASLRQVPRTAACFIVEYLGGYWGATTIVAAAAAHIERAGGSPA